MIDLSTWSVDVLRRINLRLFEDPRFQYDLDSFGGFDPEDHARRRIRNVRRVKIQRILDAAPRCRPTQNDFRDWWVIWMPVAAGPQIWPDGNHRTAMAMAELVAERLSLEIVFDPETMESLRVGSKQLIVERHRQRQSVKPEEFLDPDHPLRRFYATFRDKYDLRPLGTQV